jgi:hypothetical protein
LIRPGTTWPNSASIGDMPGLVPTLTGLHPKPDPKETGELRQ